MPEVDPELLADHTTLRLGGPAARWVRAETESELIEAVSAADAAGDPVLVLGGGSNVVVADAGFPGTVVEVATRGIQVRPRRRCRGVLLGRDRQGAAGEPWDPFVALAVEKRWAGIEALAGIPGLVGATPIQNVGAYGQEVSETIASVRVWDRRLRGVRTFAAADCGFGYRTSRFKQDPGRHVVLDVTFQLPLGTYGPPLEYAELARTLNLEVGQRAPHRVRTRGRARAADAARGWSSTPSTTTPGRQARSSPTRSSPPRPCRRVLRRGRSPTGR